MSYSVDSESNKTQANTSSNKILLKIKRVGNSSTCVEDMNPPQNQQEEQEQEAEQEPPRQDLFCWICHFDTDLVACCHCQRQFHKKCLTTVNVEYDDPDLPDWKCYECQLVETAKQELKVLSSVTSLQFYAMLGNAVRRLKYNGTEAFQTCVDTNLIPEYIKYVVHPMDISLMEAKIERREYTTLQELLQDMKWLVHNCFVFNGAHSKFTSTAKSIMRMLKHEISEIEVCADCYWNSINQSDENWFTEPCRVPHLLVFAKVRGFPYWPAKALRAVGTDLDVRFFGAHDRSLVPLDRCYWLSKDNPVSFKNHQTNMQRSVAELELHIKKLKEKFGSFKYAENMSPITLDTTHLFLPKLAGTRFLPIMESPKNLRNSNRRSLILNTLAANFTSNAMINSHNSSDYSSKAATVSTKEVGAVVVAEDPEQEKRVTRLTKRSSVGHSNESLNQIDVENSTDSNSVDEQVKQNARKQTHTKQKPAPQQPKSISFAADTKLTSGKRKSGTGLVRTLTSSSNVNDENTKRIKIETNSADVTPKTMDLTVDISDPIEESLMTKDKEVASECEEKRIKELRRIEKVLLQEKKQLEMLEKEQVMKMGTEETTSTENNNNSNNTAESNSSPTTSKMNSPIRIKISLNNPNPETKSGSASTSTSSLSSSTKQTNKGESIKINLGELVRNSKTKRSSESLSTSPVLLESQTKPNNRCSPERSLNDSPEAASSNKIPADSSPVTTPKSILKKIDRSCEQTNPAENVPMPEEVKAAKNLAKIVQKLNVLDKPAEVDHIVDTTVEAKKPIAPFQSVILLNKEIQTEVVEEDRALQASTRDKMESELKATMAASLKRYQEMKDDQSKKVIEELKSTYEMLINEIKYNSELKIKEILQEALKEKKKLKLEHEKKIATVKRKQWCANCSKESIYYCCWNTSYCDEECQKIHWSRHLKTCSRINDTTTASVGTMKSSNRDTNGHGFESNEDEYSENSAYCEELGRSPIHPQTSKNTTMQASNFDLNRHYQQQQQQQRILKQKRSLQTSHANQHHHRNPRGYVGSTGKGSLAAAIGLMHPTASSGQIYEGQKKPNTGNFKNTP